jgi:hypothetical protein
MRRTILLLATMALTLLVASGVALAVTKIGSAGAQSSVVGPGESIQKAINAADLPRSPRRTRPARRSSERRASAYSEA